KKKKIQLPLRAALNIRAVSNVHVSLKDDKSQNVPLMITVDHPQLVERAKVALKKIFKQFAKNKDGTMSHNDMRYYIFACGEGKGSQSIFHNIDQLDANEFLSSCRPSRTSKYFNLLFDDCLTLCDSLILYDAWKLLFRLLTNNAVRSQVSTLAIVEKETDWMKLLQTDNLFRLVYIDALSKNTQQLVIAVVLKMIHMFFLSEIDCIHIMEGLVEQLRDILSSKKKMRKKIKRPRKDKQHSDELDKSQWVNHVQMERIRKTNLSV
ncbi:hypothetical protein RFI_26712, partial [Reticulomyxa filosa]